MAFIIRKYHDARSSECQIPEINEGDCLCFALFLSILLFVSEDVLRGLYFMWQITSLINQTVSGNAGQCRSRHSSSLL